MSDSIKSEVGPKYASIIAAAKGKWPAITDKTKINMSVSEIGVDLQNNPIVNDVMGLRTEFRPSSLLDEFDADYDSNGDALLIVKRVPPGTFGKH